MSREVATVRDLRRQQVVAAARAIVAQQGLEALTFAALERELGYTRGVITWHFRNKDEIVAAVLHDAVEDIDRVALPAIVAEQTFADRARAAGVAVELRVWEGMVHDWHFLANVDPVGLAAIEEIAAFVARVTSRSA